jgi:uncharacterized lipoprotein
VAGAAFHGPDTDCEPDAMRAIRVLTLTAVLFGLAAGCSSSPSSRSSGLDAFQQRQAYAEGLIYQCALTRGLMNPPDFAQLAPLPQSLGILRAAARCRWPSATAG